MGKALYCNVCGASLRTDLGRCANGCCAACHDDYCTPGPRHKLDIEKAREMHTARLLRIATSTREGPPAPAGRRK